MKESSQAIGWIIGISILLLIVVSGIKGMQKLVDETFKDNTTQQERDLYEKNRQMMRRAEIEQKQFWRDQRRNLNDMKRMR